MRFPLLNKRAHRGSECTRASRPGLAQLGLCGRSCPRELRGGPPTRQAPMRPLPFHPHHPAPQWPADISPLSHGPHLPPPGLHFQSTNFWLCWEPEYHSYPRLFLPWSFFFFRIFQNWNGAKMNAVWRAGAVEPNNQALKWLHPTAVWPWASHLTPLMLVTPPAGPGRCWSPERPGPQAWHTFHPCCLPEPGTPVSLALPPAQISPLELSRPGGRVWSVLSPGGRGQMLHRPRAQPAAAMAEAPQSQDAGFSLLEGD